MYRVIILLIALTDVACAQIVKQDDSLQEQIVPESFALTGSATASKFNWAWRTSVSYTVVNKSGINLHLGLMQNGVSLGSCGDAESTQSGQRGCIAAGHEVVQRGRGRLAEREQ